MKKKQENPGLCVKHNTHTQKKQQHKTMFEDE